MVVSNTPPLSNLLHLDMMPVLAELFPKVHIPCAVEEELNAAFLGHPAWRQCLADGLIVVETVENALLVTQLVATLHQGEAENLCLTLERNASLLLVDDRDARDVATASGLNVCGTVGLLVRAKHLGLIETAREHMDALRSHHHFWISDGLYRRALRLAGEETV